MPNPYTIDFSADLTPALSMFAAARNASKANKRADRYADMQETAMAQSAERHSHEVERQKAEDERRHQIEAITAMPTLMRAAQQSTGLGNMYGKPHGVSFSETHDLPANVEGPEMSPDAEAARFASAGQPVPAPEAPEQAIPQPPPDFSRERMPSVSAEMRGAPQEPQMQASGYQGGGMDAFGDAERARAAGNMDAVGAGLQGERQVVKIDEPFVIDDKPDAEPTGVLPGPEVPLMARAAANTLNMEPGPEGKRRLIASYGGGSFAVPEQSETTGFGEKYDAIYKRALQEPGVTPEEAYKFVAKMAHDDSTEAGKNQRFKESITSRETSREDTQQFGREMGLSRDDKLSEAEKNRIAAMERTKEGGKFRVAASAPTLKIDTANRQDIGTLRQGFKEWKNTVNLAIDSKSHKRLATAMSNLESGNAMQEREAAESLVAIFKGGGQVTKASQDLLLKHLAGIVGDAETWLQHAISGNFGSRELNVLKQATKNALKEEQEKLHGYYESAVDTFGPGSGYEQLGGNVNALVKGAFKQFGYDAPSVYAEESEPVVLGSGQRPKAPKAKAKIPAGAVMGTFNGKRGYALDGKFVPIE